VTSDWKWETASDTEGAGIVVVKKRKSGWKVLGLWKDGGYDIPKGHIEPGDGIFQTALRETYEESNISNLDFQWGKKYVRVKKLNIFLASTRQNPKIKKNKETGIYEHERADWLDWETMKEECYDYLVPAINWAQMKVENET
tara:strand:+ start:239 stop:664 length:426 start_codon:yes stop_codon:yes gene_type:complete